MTLGDTDLGAADETHAADRFVQKRRLGMGRAVIAQEHKIDACVAGLARDLLERREPVGKRRVNVKRSPEITVGASGLVADEEKPAQQNQRENEAEEDRETASHRFQGAILP